MAERESRLAKAGREQSPLYRWLSAPLQVTAVGAAIAGLLIPRIASRVDDHRKAREIQTSLIQDVGEAVAKVTVTGQLLATRSIRKENANGTSIFDASLLDGEIANAVIGAQLGSYFARAKLNGELLPDAWSRYGRAVDDLYYLGTTELPDRCVRTKRLMSYLASGSGRLSCAVKGWTGVHWGAACRSAVAWDALALCDEASLKGSGEGYVRGASFFTAYRSITAKLLARESPLLHAIRASTPSGF